MKELLMFLFITLSLLIGNGSVTYIEEEVEKPKTTFSVFRTYDKKKIIREMEDVYFVSIKANNLKPYDKKLVDMVADILLYDIAIDDIEIDGNQNKVTFRIRATSFNRSGVKKQFGSLGQIEFVDSDGNVFKLIDIAEIEIREMEKHLN